MNLRHRLVACALVLVSLAGCHGAETACGEDEYSAGFERIGVLRSTDGGATWAFLGDACFHAPELIPVDPSPLPTASGVALYFLDLRSLNQPAGAARVIYRAESRNGLEFNEPAPAFLFGENITDPYILQLGASSYRMYLLHLAEVQDIISATSRDGLVFTLDEGSRTKEGAIPGALLLPDGRVRLFVAGDPRGIKSLISGDGLAFTMEEGLRIATDGISTTDPHPIRLRSGGYMMVYTVHREGTYADEQARLAAIEIHIAISADSFNWTVNPAPIAHGSVPGLVEATDGTLYTYYVDASHHRNP
ncbi:MAG: hypothetical protein WBB65_07275 [Anaerolineales bacterium]